MKTNAPPAVKIARLYLRVSTEEQDLTRQTAVVDGAKAAGYYVAGIYREKASGARLDRPELQRMIGDLQDGEVVIAERMDRLTRLPLADAEKLIASIRAKGAKLAIPGVIDLSDIAASTSGVTKIILDALNDAFLRLALQMARDDYEDRRERQRQGIAIAKAGGVFKGRLADPLLHKRVIEHRTAGRSITEAAALAKCSASQVKRIWARHQESARKLRT